jgi:formylglycine-generating enzyme required for sulfatase activity
MRWLALFVLALSSTVIAAEQYPLWDGHESVADYAKRVNLSPTKTLDLGNGVKLEVVLIPAGEFMMGEPEPTPLEVERSHKKIVIGQALLASGTGILLALMITIAIQSIRKRQRPKFSLARLLAMTFISGVGVTGGLQWRQSARGLEKARMEYSAAQARYGHVNPEEKPGHLVTLMKPYYMGRYDVTQEQYQQVIGTNPSQFIGKDNPVETVSWNEATAFCKKVTEQTKQSVRLPTEAEWEYACRAGTSTTYYSGESVTDLERVAWHSGNSKDKTHPVGQKGSNSFDLYDMHGNVWQWCSDWFDDNYYRQADTQNPKGPKFGFFRVLRGGSNSSDLRYCRSATRFEDDPGCHEPNIGFRVVVLAPDAP